MRRANQITFTPDFGGEPATTTSPRNWCSAVRCAASPALQALLAEVRDTERAYRKEREAGAAMRGPLAACPAATHEDIQAAIDAVEAPEILRVPLRSRTAVSITFSDGSVAELPPCRPYSVLAKEEIAAHFAGDPQRAADAYAARKAFDADVQAAIKRAHEAARSPEAERAYKANKRWEREKLHPVYEAWQAAKHAVFGYTAATAADRLAQFLALFEMEGGKVSRSGQVYCTGDAFEGPDGVRLAQFAIGALQAATVAPAGDEKFDAGGWIDAFEQLPGHTVDGRGPCFMEPDAWPDGDFGKGPTGRALWTALSPAQKDAVRREGATRHPLVPPGTDFTQMTYTPVSHGSGPAIPRELYAAE